MCLQDGTINYLSLPTITEGLRFLSAYLPFLPLRLSCLLNYLITSLSDLRHDTTGNPVVQILSRIPEKRVTAIGEQSETGSTVSLLFLAVSFPPFPHNVCCHLHAPYSLTVIFFHSHSSIIQLRYGVYHCARAVSVTQGVPRHCSTSRMLWRGSMLALLSVKLKNLWGGKLESYE